MLNELIRKFSRLITRGQTTLEGARSVQTSGAGEDDIAEVQIARAYGLASSLPAKTKVVMIAPSGDRGQAFIVGVLQAENEPMPATGEVILWNASGAQITLKNDGSLAVVGDLAIAGNLSVQGKISATETISAKKKITSDEDVIAGQISLKNHTHQYIDNIGQPPAPTPANTQPPNP